MAADTGSDMPDPLSDNTASLLAAEALYFTANRGMSEEAVAELLGVSVDRLRWLLDTGARRPVEFIPTPEEIAAECDRLRPGKQFGMESPKRSPAAILARMIATERDWGLDREAA